MTARRAREYSWRGRADIVAIFDFARPEGNRPTRDAAVLRHDARVFP
jgi:hypothetical protein